MKLRGKPVEVEGIQYTGSNEGEIVTFLGTRLLELKRGIIPGTQAQPNKGWMSFHAFGGFSGCTGTTTAMLYEGDWVLRSAEGDVWAMKAYDMEKFFGRLE